MKGGPKSGSGPKDGASERSSEPRLSEAQRAEDLADEEWLAKRERGSSQLPHIDPQRAEGYQRIEEAIADLPELSPPAGWDAELRAQLAAMDRGGAALPAGTRQEGGAKDLDVDSDGEEGVDAGDEGGLGVAMEMPSDVPIVPLSSIQMKKPRETARGSTREMARTPREISATAAPPRKPFPLWAPAVGSLAMAAGVLVMAFGAGGRSPDPQEASGGSEATASHVHSTHAIAQTVAKADVAPSSASGARGVSRDAAQRLLPSSVIAAPGMPMRRGAPGAAAIGDRFSFELQAPPGQLRLYRNNVEVARCPGAAECVIEERGAEQRVSLQYPMGVPGEYRAVFYQGAAMPARSHGLAEDQRRCRQLGEQSPDGSPPACRWQMAVAHEVK